jgi:ribosomal protein L11 methylase PrmA
VLVLDAGCGMGRYLRIAAEAGARPVVGLDVSAAVNAARDLTADLPNVALVRKGKVSSQTGPAGT